MQLTVLLATLIFAACGDATEKNFTTLSDAITLKKDWVVIDPTTGAQIQFQRKLIVQRRQPVELIDGRQVQPQHVIIEFTGDASPAALDAVRRQNADNATQRQDTAQQLGMHAIPRDPVSGACYRVTILSKKKWLSMQKPSRAWLTKRYRHTALAPAPLFLSHLPGLAELTTGRSIPNRRNRL